MNEDINICSDILSEIYEPCWNDSLNGKKPPKQYVDDFVSYGRNFKYIPSLTEFVLHGLSYEEAVKMRQLFYIEKLKSILKYRKYKGIYTQQEIELFEFAIGERIREYNEDV